MNPQTALFDLFDLSGKNAFITGAAAWKEAESTLAPMVILVNNVENIKNAWDEVREPNARAPKIF